MGTCINTEAHANSTSTIAITPHVNVQQVNQPAGMQIIGLGFAQERALRLVTKLREAG